jgi:DNA processing protein
MISWIALNLIEGLKPIHRAALLKRYGHPDAIFEETELDLAAAVPEIRSELAYRIAHFDFADADQEVLRAERAAIQILCLEDPQYPPLLKNIPDPPVVLYIRGKLLTEEPAVALVGSRKATAYGLNVTQFLAKDLSFAGITVVSGLARGIDARAHQAVVDVGGRTVGVLGSGADVIYPSEHNSLAAKIAESGAVISEFPLGTPPNRENFPIRNRIISGLCSAVVIVEASTKSGSLITARMAAEQGREVLAVPGSIFNESSQGCHALIKDGATLVQSWKDIVAVMPDGHLRENQKAETSNAAAPRLSDMEKDVIELLSFDQPKHLDHLAVLTGIRSQDLSGALVSLEMKNYITQMPGKQFIRLK